MMKESTDLYKGHVLVVPYPSQGHINPLLQFAKRLVSKGIKATLATTHYTLNSIHVPNVAVFPISDGFDESGFAQAKDVASYLNSFKTNGSTTLSQLIQTFKNSGDFPVNCIVYDSFLPWALDVAKQHGIYGAPFFTNSAAVCSIFCRLHHGLLRIPVELEGDDKALCLPGLPPLYGSDLPTFLQNPDSYPAYLAMKLSQFQNLDIADWVFVNTFQQLESKDTGGVQDLWPAKFIGPMVPSAYLGLTGPDEDDKGYGASLWKPLGEECIKWLETKQPQSVVYISFGSMVSLSIKQMEEIAFGLKETNFNFFWVIRQSEMDKLPTGFVESTKDKGMIVTWCNQLELLAHKALGCFVTHCGWNSTLEALSLGVPMVCVPQWTDQLPNAKFIEDVWMVGVRAKEDEKGVVGRDEVVRCLKLVMEGKKSQEIKKNARIWKLNVRTTIGEGGQSDKEINDFVESLKFPNNKRFH